MTDTANRWYFDFISPFAYLQWPKVRALMADHPIVPVPILLAADLRVINLECVISARGRGWRRKSEALIPKIRLTP